MRLCWKFRENTNPVYKSMISHNFVIMFMVSLQVLVLVQVLVQKLMCACLKLEKELLEPKWLIKKACLRFLVTTHLGSAQTPENRVGLKK